MSRIYGQALWPPDGKDAYFNAKTKAVVRKDDSGRLKPLFVQFILDQIWSVYNAVLIEDDQVGSRTPRAPINIYIISPQINLQG